jgi:polysaccharide biosynthesis/export protein
MSVRKSCLSVAIIIVAGLIFIAQAAAQSPTSNQPDDRSRTVPQQKSDTEAVAGTTPSPDLEDGSMVRDIMRRFRDNYRLGPDDELSIRVHKQPDYSLEKVKVSPVGAIYHPLLGEVNVAGLTIEQLKKQLTAELSEYVLDPTVYIELITASSAKYGVIGEIPRPGIFVMTRPIKVLDAIIEAGGITDMGKKSAVTVLRQPLDGNKQLITVNVKRILEGKARPDENIPLQAGDTVIVHGNAMKTLTKITAVTGLASLFSFIAIGGGK